MLNIQKLLYEGKFPCLPDHDIVNRKIFTTNAIKTFLYLGLRAPFGYFSDPFSPYEEQHLIKKIKRMW
jgi:hypothetical protein